MLPVDKGAQWTFAGHFAPNQIPISKQGRNLRYPWGKRPLFRGMWPLMVIREKSLPDGRGWLFQPCFFQHGQHLLGSKSIAAIIFHFPGGPKFFWPEARARSDRH